ncbi:MAG: hypothetical protein R3B53_03445 [Candidatus Paceibacterota bacterium]
MPLTIEQINDLRANSPRRIEKFRSTMLAKRTERLARLEVKIKKELGTLSKRDVFIGGLFLYWGEGGKTNPYTTTLVNTDVAMIRFYLKWLVLLGVKADKVKIRLHLYHDMDIKKEINFWHSQLGIPINQFNKPQIKKTKQKVLSRKGFGHGTCNVIVGDRDFTDKVLTTLKVLAKDI